MNMQFPTSLRQTCTRTLLAILLTAAWPAGGAWAGVIQRATAANEIGGVQTESTDQVFELASGDISRAVFASVGSSGVGSPGYFGNSSAGVFGQLGLDAGVFTSGGAPAVRTEVLIGSDEFINLGSRSGTVSSRFIIDGGQIRDFFSTNTTVTFTLEVGAEVRGAAPAITNASDMATDAAFAAGFGSAGGFFPGFEGGGYIATFSTDGSGNTSLSTTATGGLDLRAVLDPIRRTVDIPFSLQQLDLGVLRPGERLLVGYRASILIDVDGITEGTFASFSDPFALSSNSILSSLAFTPDGGGGSVPTPGTLSLLLVAWAAVRAADQARRRD
ncbi:MAG: hypothetical protein KDH20_03185 [Rhodocyclaceae bacterium]|nr:hypothetical protein [Rhodocyclaceae bacterium]